MPRGFGFAEHDRLAIGPNRDVTDEPGEIGEIGRGNAQDRNSSGAAQGLHVTGSTTTGTDHGGRGDDGVVKVRAERLDDQDGTVDGFPGVIAGTSHTRRRRTGQQNPWNFARTHGNLPLVPD
ncbi:hypothetical protein OIE48_20375 [Streptosporangium sp. NBC_01756]|nr:hypothetical protein [Streptosporangium sp. NBC_01756]WSC90439.1 hypothetical protein OIE48_20375 [Streptosporangium sp. NBC_01756]